MRQAPTMFFTSISRMPRNESHTLGSLDFCRLLDK